MEIIFTNKNTLSSITDRNRRVKKIAHERRLCNLCKTEIGDEFHYALVYRELENIRKQYLQRHFYVRPTTVKFSELFNCRNTTILRILCAFISDIFAIVKNQ